MADESEATASNLSRGGAFIQTLAPYNLGDLIYCEVSLPGEEARLKLVGVVRWRQRDVEPRGVGIEIIEAATADRNRINKFVDRESRRRRWREESNP